MSAKNPDLILRISKFISVPLILGVVTIWVNSDFQNRQEETARINQEKQLELEEFKSIGLFVEYAVNADEGTRRRFAEYFVAMTKPGAMQDRWIFYRDNVVGKEIQMIKEKIIRKQYILKNSDLSSEEKENLMIEIESLKETISGNLDFAQFENDMEDKIGLKVSENSQEIAELKEGARKVSFDIEINRLLRDEKYEEVIELDPSNTTAHYKLLLKKGFDISSEDINSDYTFAKDQLFDSKNYRTLVFIAWALYDSRPTEAEEIMKKLLTECELPENGNKKSSIYMAIRIKLADAYTITEFAFDKNQHGEQDEIRNGSEKDKFFMKYFDKFHPQ